MKSHATGSYMVFAPSLLSNLLIDSLPEEDRDRFLSDCETVDLEFGQVLSEPGEEITYWHFPIDSAISQIITLDCGARLEVSIAGNEGMVGISPILDGQASSLQLLVQKAGRALRMSTPCYLDHLKRSLALDRLVKRYLNVLINQVSQSAACTYFHEVTPRLASRLLMIHDRTSGDEMHLTHESLATMLGVRRASATLAAKSLRRHGLINYRRGTITVHDRPGLEQTSCRCFVDDWKIHSQMFEPSMKID